jgi:hypothetical protein
MLPVLLGVGVTVPERVGVPVRLDDCVGVKLRLPVRVWDGVIDGVLVLDNVPELVGEREGVPDREGVFVLLWVGDLDDVGVIEDV